MGGCGGREKGGRNILLTIFPDLDCVFSKICKQQSGSLFHYVNWSAVFFSSPTLRSEWKTAIFYLFTFSSSSSSSTFHHLLISFLPPFSCSFCAEKSLRFIFAEAICRNEACSWSRGMRFRSDLNGNLNFTRLGHLSPNGLRLKSVLFERFALRKLGKSTSIWKKEVVYLQNVAVVAASIHFGKGMGDLNLNIGCFEIIWSNFKAWFKATNAH